jgi:phospholipid/cholesterol/gamma-HCH transport system substrate-binding protein
MENRSYTVGAGLFVLLLIALLIGGILWFDERGHLRGVPYDLISNSSVTGLTVGATVRLRGVEIGQVQSIRLRLANSAIRSTLRSSSSPISCKLPSRSSS